MPLYLKCFFIREYKIHDKGTVGVQREPTQRFDARKSRVSFGGDHIKVFGRDSRYVTLAVQSISSNHHFLVSVKYRLYCIVYT